LFVKENLLGEKNGKEIGKMLNIVVKNADHLKSRFIKYFGC